MIEFLLLIIIIILLLAFFPNFIEGFLGSALGTVAFVIKLIALLIIGILLFNLFIKSIEYLNLGVEFLIIPGAVIILLGVSSVLYEIILRIILSKNDFQNRKFLINNYFFKLGAMLRKKLKKK